jgi:hypothetical protein
LILYLTTLLKLFMVSRSIFGSLKYRFMSSTVSLPICITFISSSCLIALARNSSTMLNESGESGHPYLIPEFWGNCFSLSP